jgi:hypothetical protein
MILYQIFTINLFKSSKYDLNITDLLQLDVTVSFHIFLSFLILFFIRTIIQIIQFYNPK